MIKNLSISINKNYFSIIKEAIYEAFTSPYYGFVAGHFYLPKVAIQEISDHLYVENYEIIQRFEREYALLIGSGECISYAFARMGFYDLMTHLDIKNGDEVILLGSTCSVMSEAVLKVGATPVYSDISLASMGSEVVDISRKISKKTKMIVAQHSFGIPCDIGPIVQLAKENKIFLLEDCALTLGSKYLGINVGNFGDAALFSLDHTKPINTIYGGLIYSKNIDLIAKLKIQHTTHQELSPGSRHYIFKKLLLERNFCNSKKAGLLTLMNLIGAIKTKILKGLMLTKQLNREYSSLDLTNIYPARYPTFLAILGIHELRRWQQESIRRKNILSMLIKFFVNQGFGKYLPAAYSDNRLEITPLRFVLIHPGSKKIKEAIKKFISIGSFWFTRPVIGTDKNLELLGYYEGMCPISEAAGRNIINIPCNIPELEMSDLIARIENAGLLLSV